MSGIGGINFNVNGPDTPEARARRQQVLDLINQQTTQEAQIEDQLAEDDTDTTSSASSLLGTTSSSDSLSLGTVSPALASANLTPAQLQQLMTLSNQNAVKDPYSSAASLVYQSMASKLDAFNS